MCESRCFCDADNRLKSSSVVSLVKTCKVGHLCDSIEVVRGLFVCPCSAPTAAAASALC